jgi:hypothetical protein
MKTQKLTKKKQAKTVPLTADATDRSKKTVKAQSKPRTDRTSAIELSPITHEKISQRAWSIWMSKGCPSGQDEMHWYQAEQELRMQAYQG